MPASSSTFHLPLSSAVELFVDEEEDEDEEEYGEPIHYQYSNALHIFLQRRRRNCSML